MSTLTQRDTAKHKVITTVLSSYIKFLINEAHLLAGKKIKLGYDSTVYSQGRSFASASNLVEREIRCSIACAVARVIKIDV